MKLASTSLAWPRLTLGGSNRQSAEPRRPTWRHVIALLEVRWTRVALAVAFGSLALGCSVALAGASAWLIARASQMPPVLTLSLAVVGVRAAGIGRGVLRYTERLAAHGVALRGMESLRANAYEALARQPVEALLPLRRGDMLARLGADVDEVGNLVVRVVIPAAVALVVGIGSVAFLGALLPGVAVVLGAALVLSGVVAPLWVAAHRTRCEAAVLATRADVAARTLALLEEGDQLRVAGAWGGSQAALRHSERRAQRALAASATARSLAVALQVLLGSATVTASVWLAMGAVDRGLSRVGVAVAVLTPMAVFEATAGLVPAAIQWGRSLAAAQRLLALIGPPAPAESTVSLGTHSPGTHSPGQLLLRQQHASGPPGKPLLRADGVTLCRGSAQVIDLALLPGDVVVVAGASGSGKSTLLLTLAGALAPAAGEVTASPDLDRVLVAEDGHLFATTVLENLRVARGQLSADEARAALQVVGLGPWVDALPQGLDTVIGTGGGNISGGQRRRLLVARGLVRQPPAEAQRLPQPLVLLLDEPTEHLDLAGGAGLYEALTGWANQTGNAIVIATHHTF